MFNFLSRQKFTPKFYKKNYSDLVNFNHYRDVRLHDKYAKDIIKKKYNDINMSNKVNDTISNSLIYTYKDYRNHLLQEKYKK